MYHRKAADTRIASRSGIADAMLFHRPRALLIAEKPLFVSAIFDYAPPVADQIGTLASEEDHVRGNFTGQEPHSALLAHLADMLGATELVTFSAPSRSTRGT